MNDLSIDASAREASMRLPRSLYSREALEIAAQVLASKAQVLLACDKKSLHVTVRAVKKTAAPADLEALAGELVNEVLNQEYRFVVARFNQKISQLIVTRTLLAARGGENPPAAPKPSPELERELEKLMEQAREEIRRTMPKRIPPQGAPIAPAAEEKDG